MYTLTLLGDLMLGRLIDQLLPHHVDEPEEARLVKSFRDSHGHLRRYYALSPWGNVVPLLRRSDLVLGNLETSATTHNGKWPGKSFNYRMHPDNVRCLTEAGIDYVSLANNHTLDFGRDGLLETVETIRQSHIAFAGVGKTEVEANMPAKLSLSAPEKEQEPEKSKSYMVHLFSLSDHPHDWRGVPEFKFLDYSESYQADLKKYLNRGEEEELGESHLKIVSIHWGPNYQWHPHAKIVAMAHFLIDECGIDIIHGHSSHHIQGVEIYRNKLIVYGCGDFIDDYAINHEYRNDLSAAWNVQVEAVQDGTLQLRSLEVFPNRIRHFQAGLLDQDDADHEWVCKTFRSLCKDLGTVVEVELGEQGQMIVPIQ